MSAPAFVQRVFRRRLHRYEMRDVMDADPPRDVIGVPALSGAFMLVKRFAIDRTGGFDPRFFLYFEDYDWSVRLNAVTRSAYLPAMRVVHHGGRASTRMSAAEFSSNSNAAIPCPAARLPPNPA